MKSPLKTSLKITSTDTGEYRYFFNGQEADNELFGEMSNFGYEFRQYDSRLVRWWSIDPKWNEYPRVSPYVFCNGSPVMLMDPNGMEIGDYYNYEGKYLGSDNIDDKKVYVASGRTDVINKDGTTTTTFNNAKDLGITHTQFCTIANIIKQESSHANNEDLWIAHTSNNAAKRSGKTWYSKLMSGYSSVKNKTPLSTSDASSYANSARAATINVLTGGSDPTGGASLWDGTDFLAKGTSQNKFKEYKSISISANIYNTYLNNNLSKYTSGYVKYDQTYYLIPASVFYDGQNWTINTFIYNTDAKRNNGIEATGTIGRTIFWKITQ